MQVKARLNHLHMSPRKVRRVAKLIRGLSAARAEAELLARPEQSAEPVLKLLRSAMANARQKTDARAEEATIAAFTVNPGPTMKRFRPRSRGMAHPIVKRMSHLSLVLELPHATNRRRTMTQDVSKGEPYAPPKKAHGQDATKPQEAEETEAIRQKPAPPRPFVKRARMPKLPVIGRKFFQRKSV